MIHVTDYTSLKQLHTVLQIYPLSHPLSYLAHHHVVSILGNGTLLQNCRNTDLRLKLVLKMSLDCYPGKRKHYFRHCSVMLSPNNNFSALSISTEAAKRSIPPSLRYIFAHTTVPRIQTQTVQPISHCCRS